MYIRDIIDKKRKREILTEEEIKFFVFGYFKEEITEAQAAALLTAMHIYGLTEKELTYMITAISETGEELQFYRISNKIVDIHSLGGMSDKVILILLAVLHSLGITAAKIIGRELGMEDRLISLQGYKLEEDVNVFKKKIREEGIGILKSIKDLAPVEKKLYKLRHEIACDNDMELIASSIMSQKMALGCANIFFEITYGENAYVKTIKEAKILSKYLINIGNKLLRNVGCGITRLNEPVGNNFGNLLELKEVYNYLNGEEIADIDEMVLKFGSNILKMINYCQDTQKNKKIIKDAIVSKKALNSFENLISNQTGNIEILKKEINAKNVIPVMANQEGYIVAIDVNKVRMLARYLNAIRVNEDDYLDIGAGIVFNKKVGQVVKKGELLAYIYTNDDTKIEQAVSNARELFAFSNKKIKTVPRVVLEE